MAHHVYSNQWCYSLMINYHTPDNHQILVVRSAFIKTTWISIPQKASVFAEWPTAKMSQWAFSLMDTWSDWEQIFQVFATKRRVEKVYFVKKRVPVMNGQQWNAFGDVQLHIVQFPPGVTYRPRSDHSHWWWSKIKQWQTQTQGHLGAPSDLQTKVWSFMIETMVELINVWIKVIKVGDGCQH